MPHYTILVDIMKCIKLCTNNQNRIYKLTETKEPTPFDRKVAQ
jgi:hypothetical protein